MYAHQVLESMDSIRRRIPDSSYVTASLVVQKALEASKKFYLGDGLDLLRIFESSFNTKESQTLFSNSDYLRLPFHACWFEYTWPNTEFTINKKKISMADGDAPVTKRSILVNQVAEDCLSVTVFNYYKSIGWDMSPFVSMISVGKPLYKCDHIISLLNKMKEPLPEEGEDTNYICVPLLKNKQIIPQELWNKMFHQETDLDFKTLYCALLFLNCKGIVQRRIDPPEKLNKKRKNLNKPPLFSYYVLEIEQSTKKEFKKYDESDRNIRLHECRGHFKEYTKDAPLFGKYTGLYWWEPQWRGRLENGIIMKDYKFKYKECNG